jgi:hypothetical protein
VRNSVVPLGERLWFAGGLAELIWATLFLATSERLLFADLVFFLGPIVAFGVTIIGMRPPRFIRTEKLARRIRNWVAWIIVGIWASFLSPFAIGTVMWAFNVDW